MRMIHSVQPGEVFSYKQHPYYLIRPCPRIFRCMNGGVKTMNAIPPTTPFTRYTLQTRGTFKPICSPGLLFICCSVYLDNSVVPRISPLTSR